MDKARPAFYNYCLVVIKKYIISNAILRKATKWNFNCTALGNPVLDLNGR